MKLSKRSEYAVRALVLLAVAQKIGRSVVRISEIAQIETIPIPFLEQIFMQLREAGLVLSRRGKAGGYRLAKPADSVFLGEIFRLIDGSLAPIACVSRTAYEKCTCPDEALCALRNTMLKVRDAVNDIVDKTSLEMMAREFLQNCSASQKKQPFDDKFLQKDSCSDPNLGVYEI